MLFSYILKKIERLCARENNDRKKDVRPST